VVLAMVKTATTFDALVLAGTRRSASCPRRRVVLSEQQGPVVDPEPPVI
jgi:hypothetical protein